MHIGKNQKIRLDKFLSGIGSKTDIVIYGYGMLGRMVEHYILSEKKELNIKHIIDDSSDSDKVISFDEFINLKDNKNICIIICVEDKKIHQKIAFNIKSKGYLYSSKIYRGSQEFHVSYIFQIAFLPIFMLKDTLSSIANIVRAISHYDWKHISGNTQKLAFVYYYYYTLDFNIQKYGINSTKNMLSGKGLSLKKLFHLTPVSLRLQSAFGTTFLIFMFMVVWSSSWLLIFGQSEGLLPVLLITVFSTYFFAVFIENENYNIVGFALMPIFIYALFGESYLALGLIIFIMALTSFTAVVIGFVLLSFYASYFQTVDFIIYLLPAILLIAMKLYNAFYIGGIEMIGRGIGFFGQPKYERTKKIFSISNIYVVLAQIQFIAIVYNFYYLDNMLILLILPLILFITNTKYRFADEQSIIIFLLTCYVFILLSSDVDSLILLSFFLAINIPYRLIKVGHINLNSFFRPGVRVPYNSSLDVDGLMKMLEGVHGTVIHSHKNPDRKYSNIFNGYRMLIEPVHYACCLKNINYLPDWWMVFENNHIESSEDFWIDTPSKAVEYMTKNEIEFVLVPDYLYSHEWEAHFKDVSSYTFNLIDEIHNHDKHTLFLMRLNKSD